MRYLLAIVFTFSLLLASCKGRQGATNEYKNAKKHPSDEYAKEHKKAARKAQRDFLKTQKENKKGQQKKGNKWFKKKKQYR